MPMLHLNEISNAEAKKINNNKDSDQFTLTSPKIAVCLFVAADELYILKCDTK